MEGEEQPRYGLYVPPAKQPKERLNDKPVRRDVEQLKAPFLKAQLTQEPPSSGPKYLPALLERAAEKRREQEQRRESSRPKADAPEVFVTSGYMQILEKEKDASLPGPRRPNQK